MRKVFKFIFILLVFSTGCQQQTALPPSPVYPIPDDRQLQWQDLEFYAFVHFNMNTFTNMEWGTGAEDPETFQPTALDCRQWARICKEAGMKGIILTAKHHDGFCLWPSAYTEHSVKNSSWKNGNGDVLRELADACQEFGLKMGLYYSPWDRNHAEYGNEEYILYMRNQLTEILTNYGELFEVWFDGANGGNGYYGGANEERRVDKLNYYDWDSTIALVRELQPGAVIFSDAGPDVRWVGNEHGYAYETTWSNLMRDSVYPGMPGYSEKYASGQEDGTHWVPAEADVSIRPGWYYHPEQDDKVKTVAELKEIYYRSIGNNSSLLLNLPVDTRGLIHENDAQRLLEFSKTIQNELGDDLAPAAKITADNTRGNDSRYKAENIVDNNSSTYWTTDDEKMEGTLEFAFPGKITIDRILLQEYIPLGQRVKSFKISALSEANWQDIYSGTTIGCKKIIRIEPIEISRLKISIEDAKASPLLSSVSIYRAGAI